MTTLDQAPVATLVVRAQCGPDDHAAFAELIRRYQSMARCRAYAALQDADLASDVVQEAFFKAWRSLERVDHPASFGTWLCGIIRNLCIDHLRRRRPNDVGIDQAWAAADRQAVAPAQEIGRREWTDRVRAALHALDDLTRSALVLKYYDDRSSREIAQLLAITPSAVNMRLFRGRRTLQEWFGADMNDAPF